MEAPENQQRVLGSDRSLYHLPRNLESWEVHLKYIVSKRIDGICSAHKLEWHPGPCRNLHGHSWSIEIAVSRTMLNENGIVVDFGALKDFLDEIKEALDHKYLNDIGGLENPTAEVLCGWVEKRFTKKCRIWQVNPEYIRVWETPNSEVEMRF